ncbi:hypothetical protein C2E23DRAFT_887594 [Lenzites betulinus]|nr:hypothetical protein C2E23DRAFT_887594 [Lenzites betulinus]
MNPQAAASLASISTTEEDTASFCDSTAALIPKAGQTSSAAAPSFGARDAPPVKNYEAAFGALSSSYGFAGVSPTKNPKKTLKKKKDDGQASPPASSTPAAHTGSTSKGGQSGQSDNKK